MRKRRSAFTLIELIASAVLAALMTAGLMSVVWSTMRETRQLRRSQISQSSVTQLAERLRADFHNARGMVIGSSGIILHGFLGDDPRTGEPLLLPGRVRYHRRTVGGRGFLVRSETGGTSEVAWIGFRRMQIEPLAEVAAEDRLLPPAETGGLPAVPRKFRVTMFGDEGQILWREVVHHHE